MQPRNSMRTNSPISDPEPLTPDPPQRPKRAKKSDWEKLAKDSKYPEIQAYIDARKKFYSRYTPGGEPVEGLTKEQRAEMWDVATTILKEFEDFENVINTFKSR
jgi:hypothetical protein